MTDNLRHYPLPLSSDMGVTSSAPVIIDGLRVQEEKVVPLAPLPVEPPTPPERPATRGSRPAPNRRTSGRTRSRRR